MVVLLLVASCVIKISECTCRIRTQWSLHGLSIVCVVYGVLIFQANSWNVISAAIVIFSVIAALVSTPIMAAMPFLLDYQVLQHLDGSSLFAIWLSLVVCVVVPDLGLKLLQGLSCRRSPSPLYYAKLSDNEDIDL